MKQGSLFVIIALCLLAGCAPTTVEDLRKTEPSTFLLEGEPSQAANCVARALDTISWGAGYSALNTVREYSDKVTVIGTVQGPDAAGSVIWVMDVMTNQDQRSRGTFYFSYENPMYSQQINSDTKNALKECSVEGRTPQPIGSSGS